MKFPPKKIWKLLQPLIIGAAFYLILRNVKFSILSETFAKVQWPWVALYLLTSLVLITFQGIRWWILIRAFTKKLPFLSAISVHFSSVFYSIILPNSTTQEIVRTLDASKKTGHVIGWSSAWVSKIIGICVSFAFSIVGLLMIPDIHLPPSVIYIVIGVFSIMILTLLLSFSKKITRQFRLLLNKHFPKLSMKYFHTIREGIYQFRNKKAWLLLSCSATVIAQMLLLGAVSILLFSITGNFFLFEVIAFIPIIEMVSMAQPFTPGGIGVREALIAIMFKQLHLSDENLATFIILSNLTIFLKLLGVIPVLMHSLKKKAMHS